MFIISVKITKKQSMISIEMVLKFGMIKNYRAYIKLLFIK